MWVYGYYVETKMQLSQWMGKGSPRPKKKNTSESVIDQGEVGFFLIGNALSIMNLYHVVRG